MSLRKTALTKGEDGAWTGTTEPLDPGFHYYQIIIDGAQVPDPGSTFFYGSSRWGSGIEIPAKDQDFYALKDVPHGAGPARICISPRSPTPGGAASSTPRRTTTTNTDGALSGALPPARHGRRRDRLGRAGQGEPDPRQPDRRREGQADDHRHGQRLRLQAGFGGRAGRECCGRSRARHFGLRGSDDQGPHPDDRRRRTAPSRTASTGRWPASRWAAIRPARSP